MHNVHARGQKVCWRLVRSALPLLWHARRQQRAASAALIDWRAHQVELLSPVVEVHVPHGEAIHANCLSCRVRGCHMSCAKIFRKVKSSQVKSRVLMRRIARVGHVHDHEFRQFVTS